MSSYMYVVARPASGGTGGTCIDVHAPAGTIVFLLAKLATDLQLGIVPVGMDVMCTGTGSKYMCRALYTLYIYNNT